METLDLKQLQHEGAIVSQDEAEITTTNSTASPVVIALQTQLANALILFLNYKTSAWQCRGRSILEMQSLLGRIAEETKVVFDEIGDRLRMIGQDPELNLESIALAATVKQATATAQEDSLMQLCGDNLILVIRELRAQIRSLRVEDEDPGTTALLIEVLRMHEEHEWLLRHLGNREASAARRVQ